ncbi:bifunctional diaminohydroxyphosphoribosylaminopyrimidine deaminase/5-amino-6-(5-phosphoribosylamino)uracil reductase RibD [Campylobacter ureolyticus]|jgi:riboflavin biosynthesis protein ribD|uniref:bifunctional diaminohydroxyphosphoribosylaminopyrimidine deaminase/5-amino-6-(5-phosphoribosylamino)uracil reductase RibD n=1 Tax=Campylobacter ureolyticus TaxID=827 RepID=UPI0022B35276|nr:bifunctional diaminohydroxyphosphoribosylaminopyrimidine deaminase/5-amino-6-(5-phosphoribosylamino)uracil reductase RibD [Campylobacter ureolyticus]MCZ6117430.1 bifunctional diaminohydroxyphosphoribosylaminopyrimidine deaminase/5-amino-6-(5-phosphoribosylamino)uracil reductase RibD [Campylobacter ureolyticus]
MNDEFYMSLAIKKAWQYQILTYPNPAVGALILDKNNQILSIEAHQKAGYNHAEVNAIKSALKKLNSNLVFPKDEKQTYDFILKNHNNLLKEAKIYVTLEPCAHHGKTPPCANLIKELYFSEVIISQKDINPTAKGGAEILKNAGIKVKFGVLQNEGFLLLEPFLRCLNGNFSFLKLGMSLNGVIKGGVITNNASRLLVHKLRNVSEILAIGGNTVRVDRPILDTRLLGKNFKNPDIFIYSKKNEFDKTIPLFSVQNREVIISNDIEKLKNYKLCMIEGGEQMARNLPPFVTHILIFFSSKFINLDSISLNLELELLFLDKLDDNYYGWFKIKR